MPLNKILQSLKGQCRYCGQNAGSSCASSTPCAATYTPRASRRWSSSPPRPPVPTPSTRAPYGHWLGASHLSAASCIDQLPAQSRGQEELHWTWDPEKDRINLQRHRISFQYWRFEETGEFHGARLAGDRLGLNQSSAHASATAQLNRTARQRLTGLTQAAATTVEDAATTVEDGDRILKQLSDALRKAGFG